MAGSGSRPWVVRTIVAALLDPLEGPETRALAVELLGDVRVLCVCPGPVDTDMMRSAVASEPDPEAARKSWTCGPLLQRVASPDEIAGAIVYAASSDCGFATGNLIVVDGGTTAGKRVCR